MRPPTKPSPRRALTKNIFDESKSSDSSSKKKIQINATKGKVVITKPNKSQLNDQSKLSLSETNNDDLMQETIENYSNLKKDTISNFTEA